MELLLQQYQTAIHKADVLLEALHWIRQFRDRHVVIKLGGSTLEEEEAVRHFLTDVIFMATVGARPILVHGGGKAISAAMSAAGLTPQFVQGRRYTDEATIDIVARVLVDEICPQIVQEIERQGGEAVGISYRTTNALLGRRWQLPGPDGQLIDLGLVGEVTQVDRDLLLSVCRDGRIPVLPSIALDETGQRLNVNADTAAAAVARDIQAEKLVFLSDVPGIFLDRRDPSTLQTHLTAAQCRELIQQGIIEAGMVPKVEAALEALQAGVSKVHLVDARIPHSILLEIYSHAGIGTEIVLA
ncbi:MAG: acetylglutamate kinase [Planctomycetaceae bacterium]|nr:MAG: acetylglutamate kinase [Planctomycetaceae bacterium]